MRPCPLLARQNFKSLSLVREGPHGAFHRVLPSRSFPRLPRWAGWASKGSRPRRNGLPTRLAALHLRCTAAQAASGLADKEAFPFAEPTYFHLRSPDSAAVPLPCGGAINPRPRRRRRRRRRRTRDVALREVGSAGHPRHLLAPRPQHQLP